VNPAKSRNIPVDPAALARFKKTFELINTHLYSVEERIRAQQAAPAPAPTPETPKPAPVARQKLPEPVRPVVAAGGGTATADHLFDANGEFTGTTTQWKTLRQAGKIR
jgi:hypothetical protein